MICSSVNLVRFIVRPQLGPHSNRRWKEKSRGRSICRKTGNLRAVQLLLGHTEMDSTVRYLGVELEDALAISEALEI